MKTIQHLLRTTFLLFGIISISFGQTIQLTQSKESGVYKSGEKLTISAVWNKVDLDSISIKILKNHQELKQEKIKVTGDTFVVFEKVVQEPASWIVEVSWGEERASIGAVVDPGKFQPGTKRPSDMDKYWKAEKKILRALPMEVKTVSEEEVGKGFSCKDIELNCTGPKPARGYFAKPMDAKDKSLPIVLVVHAAGVKGSWCLSKPQNAMEYAKKGALCFDLNAHGMLNGQLQKYYDDLEAGELSRYYEKGIENREDYYFRGMYLRLIRTLDFLCSQPEWDGKRILVVGESQGGGQSLVAAGLDDRVSAVVATVPAMCDWGGTIAGNKGGWPNPFGSDNDREKMLETVPYFDAAHLLKNSKATLVVEIGNIDYTCSSNSIYAAINQAKGEKIVFNVPYRGHHVDQKSYQKEWEETVYKPKMEFIENYLK